MRRDELPGSNPLSRPSRPIPMIQRRIPRRLHTPLACLALLTVSGCAIGNSGKLVLSRHITVGQELIDLKEALDRGAVTEEEYHEIKAKLMEIVDSIEVVNAVNDSTPDQIQNKD
jgi:putative oligomerization/nucleic acid binding protein